jgi:hypothetical protein
MVADNKEQIVHVKFCFLLGKSAAKTVLMLQEAFNPLNAKLNSIYHLLALLGAHHIFHVSKIRVKHRIKSHLPSADIIRSSPYSPR